MISESCGEQVDWISARELRGDPDVEWLSWANCPPVDEKETK